MLSPLLPAAGYQQMIKHMKTDKASYNCSTSLEILPVLVLMETHFAPAMKWVTGFFLYIQENVKWKCPSGPYGLSVAVPI